MSEDFRLTESGSEPPKANHPPTGSTSLSSGETVPGQRGGPPSKTPDNPSTSKSPVGPILAPSGTSAEESRNIVERTPGKNRGDDVTGAAGRPPAGSVRRSTITSPQAHGVETVEAAEERAKKARENPKDATFGTPLDSHPPLQEGDFIQGPNDRFNRRPTQHEIDHGKLHRQDLALLQGLSDEFEVITKNNDEEHKKAAESAPKDVPADPRKVAESRGELKPKELPEKFDPTVPVVENEPVMEETEA